MSWLFSQALVAEFSADTCSDGGQSVPSKSSHIQQAYCSPDRMTEFSRLSRYGMTFAPLTADRGEALLTSYLAAFRARTSALPEKAQESPESVADCGQKWRGSLARFDRDSSSWKTAQLSLLVDLEQSSVIWPRSGMTAGGQCWELPTLGRRTRGIGCGLRVPTPTASMITIADMEQARYAGNKGGSRPSYAEAKTMLPTPTVCGNHNRKGASKTSGDGLATAVAKWPTPTSTLGTHGGMVTPTKGKEWGTLIEALSARTVWPTATACMSKGSSPAALTRKDGRSRENVRLDHAVMSTDGGSLNPTWVEWLMGWPLEWSDLKPLETGKFRQWLRQHGGC